MPLLLLLFSCEINTNLFIIIPPTTPFYHSCLITQESGVKCWGANNNGQLGDGTRDSRSQALTVSLLNSNVKMVSIGGGELRPYFNSGHSCAVTQAGGVWCWGAWPGSADSTLAPVIVDRFKSGVNAVSAGYEHICVLQDTGVIMCWGYNSNGTVSPQALPYYANPMPILGLPGPAKAVSAGDNFTCALMKSDGRIFCWGANDEGQLGNGKSTRSSQPSEVVGINDALSISCGQNHACAVTDYGILCWGNNGYSQLGNGNNVTSYIPVNVTGIIEPVISVSAGGGFTCTAFAGGGVKCWGLNNYGQIGDETTVTRSIPTEVSGLQKGVVEIQSHVSYTCARLEDGEAKCWGRNNTGQLGDGTTTTRLKPVEVVGFK